MAVDETDTGGYAYTYSNGTWSEGTMFDTTEATSAGANNLTSSSAVSCATSSFCIAVDLDGFAWTYS
jgi:hypothetical protein